MKPARNPLERHRVSVEFPEQGRTKQAFKDECTVANVVETYARTGHISNVARLSPEYGEAPDQTLYEAACIAAELRSLDEEGRPDEIVQPEASEEASDDSKASEEAESPGATEPEGGTE